MHSRWTTGLLVAALGAGCGGRSTMIEDWETAPGSAGETGSGGGSGGAAAGGWGGQPGGTGGQVGGWGGQPGGTGGQVGGWGGQPGGTGGQVGGWGGQPGGTGGQVGGSGGRLGGTGGQLAGSGGTSCGLLGCDVHAWCDTALARPRCECLVGYRGDGIICNDINECTAGTDECDWNASCSNTSGSYTCACDTGFIGSGFECQDYDECVDGPCDANATCTNTWGSYTCACNDGYAGDGLTCSLVGPTCPDGDLGTTVPGSTYGSTASGDDFCQPGCGDSPVGSRDYAAIFTAPLTATYEVDTNGSDFDTLLSILDGRCSTASVLGCNDDSGDGLNSLLDVELLQGQTVTAVVDGYNGYTGSFILNVTQLDCPDRTLDGALPISFSDRTTQSTNSFATSCGLGRSAPDFTFAYTVELTGLYTFDTLGSDYDTVLAVRDERCSGDEIACNDDCSATSPGPACGRQSRVQARLTEGQVVTIVVAGYNGATGNFALNVAAVVN